MAEMIQVEGNTLCSTIHKPVNKKGDRTDIIEEYHCYQLWIKSHPIFLFED